MGHWVSCTRIGMPRAAYRLIGMALALAFLLSLGPVLTVRATGFSVTVTVTADSNNMCATMGTAPCSLRDAIRYANARTSADTTTITLPAGIYNLTQLGACEDAAATGDLDITQNVILNGADPATTIIDGMGSDRVFQITNSTRAVSLSNVTVRNGSASPGCGSAGGGIGMVGNVTLTNVVVTNNVARFAGGINGVGTLTLINSTVSNNVACGPGGISSVNGALTLTNSTISGNSATSSSSALASVGGCPGAVRGYAGGIDTTSVTHLTNSTISGNSNTYGYSDDTGGIRNSNSLTIAYSTIAGNTNPSGGGISNRASGSTTIQGSIIAGNAGGNCVNAGALTSQGYNLATDSSCSLTQPTDLPAAPANLGALASNGGPTQTHALLVGSLAIDAGGTSANGCPNTDQRNISRPQGARCDIGAYEAVGVAGPTPTLTSATPSSGPTSGGSKVTIHGTNLQPGSVSLGGSPCAVTAATGGTTLICTTSSHPAGTVSIVVTNPGGQNATLNAVYTYGLLNPMPGSRPGGSLSGRPSPLPMPRSRATSNGPPPNPLPPSRP